MKKVFVLLTAFLTLVMTGCGDDDWTGKGTSEREGFSLSYTIPGVTPATRSTIDIEEGEDQVNSLHILFFEKEESGKFLFVDVIDAMAEYTTSLGSTGTLEIEFTEETSLKNAAEYKILLCANIQEYTELVISIDNIRDFCYGKEDIEVIENLWLKISGVTGKDEYEEMIDNDNRMAITNIPMSAMAIKAAKETEVRVDLIRMVSRFDVYLDSSVTGYQLVSTSIWNAYTEASVWENTGRDYSGERTERYYGVTTETNSIVASLYAFENYVESPSQKDKQTTCLIVGLKNLQTNKIEYFRTNVHPTNMYQSLKRNYVYHTTITGVENEGDSTERGAYENAELKLTLDINGWTVDDYGNIQYEGENILAMPTRQINLFSEGETRVYNIFAISPDESLNLEMEVVNLSEGISARLNGKVLSVSATPNQTGIVRSGTLRFSFGQITAEISITQEFYEVVDYLNLNLYELPPFTSQGGEMSDLITVSATGDWIAEIYNSGFNTFSFEAGSEKFAIEGRDGESFNVYSIKENTKTVSHFSFVVVKLKSNPYISRVILLEQLYKGAEYIWATPSTFDPMPAGGGYTPVIKVYSSGRFDGTISISGPCSEALFVVPEDDDDEEENESTTEKEEKTYSTWNSNTRGDSFLIKVGHLTEANKDAEITVTLALRNSDKKEILTIKQDPLNPNSIVVHVRRNMSGTLFHTNKANYSNFVYNLGANMRNQSLFGPSGQVPLAEYVFISASNRDPNAQADIFQLIGNPTQARFNNYIRPWMNADPKRFLFFTNKGDYARLAMNKYQSAFGVSGYTVEAVNVAAAQNRYFHPDVEGKLIDYLLKDGPFTGGQEIDRSQILLKSRGATNRGLVKWNENTFVPIIMLDKTDSKGNTISYCVFGIDPTNRFVWSSDPGIFGSARSTSANVNYDNFDGYLHPENVKFLNNFIAWLTEALSKGEDFVGNYK